jgi:hypothetical protein
MRKAIQSMQKLLADHDASFQDHAAKTDTLHALMREHLAKFTGLATSNHVVRGHLGNCAKILNASASAQRAAVAGHAAVHEQLHKSIHALAEQAGVAVAVGNRNATAAGADQATMHGGFDTTSAGAITPGFKASGMTADAQVRLAKSLAVPTLHSQIQKVVGVPNANQAADPFGFAQSTPVPGLDDKR